ncbi:tetratricopeptide repeat protein [bacterium]|nr:MAG: tetratricopeptide repeat protein [bacterium]
MRNNSTIKPVTTLKIKITLIIFGVFLSLLLLEIGLRAGGFVLLFTQEYSNSKAMKESGTYRIMCLGESTTRGQYPVFLEEMLNRNNTGTRFSVIDKGFDGTTTTAILERINADIDRYHPSMVVTMMGINDQGGYIPHEAATPSKAVRLFRSLKVYKLARILWLHIISSANKQAVGKIQTHIPEIGSKGVHLDLISAEDSFKKAVQLDPRNVTAYFELGRYYYTEGKRLQAEGIFKKVIELYPENYYSYICSGLFYQSQGRFSQAEDSFKKAVQLDPKNFEAYLDLGQLYQFQGEFSHAEDSFREAITIDPKNVEALLELGRLYQDIGKLTQAEESFKTAIKLHPENVNACLELGWLYLIQGKLTQAEESFKTAIKLHPESSIVYTFLGWLYRDQGKLTQAEESFKTAIKLHPENVNAYLELGRLYQAQGKLTQAEESFKKAVQLDPGNVTAYFELGRYYHAEGKLSRAEDAFKKSMELDPDENLRTYEAISLLYEEMGKLEMARKYAKKANSWWLSHYSDVTVNSYRKLKEILDKRRIKFVCVQYPARSIAPLKKIFEGNEKGIIFVDNEKIFKDALKKGGSMAYFVDMFGINFGHCTKKGNRLLAENIANVILREAFHK